MRETPSVSGFAYFGWPYVHYILYERKAEHYRLYDYLGQTVQDRLLLRNPNGFDSLFQQFAVKRIPRPLLVRSQKLVVHTP